MKENGVKIIPALLSLFMLFMACKSIDKFMFLGQERKDSLIQLSNEISFDRNGGHIQGVQYYQKANNAYYFFTGSSSDQSYLAIANAHTHKILSVQKLLDEPYRHAGGFQIIDDLLVVGIEDNVKKDKSLIQVYQITDPEKGALHLLSSIERKGAYKRATAGSVAITKANQHLWICVGNWDNHDLDVYSLPLNQWADPERKDKPLHRINSEELDRSEWVEKSWFSYQNINFFWQKNQLYMAAMAEERLGGKQLLDVFACELEKKDLGLKKVSHQKFSKKGEAGFRWGGGVYVDEKGQLQLMACGEQIKEEIEVRHWK